MANEYAAPSKAWADLLLLDGYSDLARLHELCYLVIIIYSGQITHFLHSKVQITLNESSLLSLTYAAKPAHKPYPFQTLKKTAMKPTL